MTGEPEFECAECEDAEKQGCPECNDDLAECETCGTVELRHDLSDDLICSECIESEEHRRELQSDYRRSVL